MYLEELEPIQDAFTHQNKQCPYVSIYCLGDKAVPLTARILPSGSLWREETPDTNTIKKNTHKKISRIKIEPGDEKEMEQELLYNWWSRESSLQRLPFRTDVSLETKYVCEHTGERSRNRTSRPSGWKRFNVFGGAAGGLPG